MKQLSLEDKQNGTDFIRKSVTFKEGEILKYDEESGLFVSNIGRVFGPVVGEKKARPNRKKDGYYWVWGRKGEDGKKHCHYVHRIVARNFVPNPMGLSQVNHIDENKQNNRADNLEWCTPKYNARYGRRNEKVNVTKRENGVIRPITITNGTEVRHFESLVDAATALNISASCLRIIRRGGCSHGWHLQNWIPRWNAKKQFTLIKGDIVERCAGIRAAAKKLGLNRNRIRQLIKGEREEYNGWKLIMSNEA